MQNNEDIIKVLKIIQALNKQSETINSAAEENISPNIRSLKAAIPYMSFEHQKNFYIMLKIMEISDYMKKYQEIAAANVQNTSDMQRGFLMAVREQANDNQKKLIDTFIKVFELNKIMNMEMNNNAK